VGHGLDLGRRMAALFKNFLGMIKYSLIVVKNYLAKVDATIFLTNFLAFMAQALQYN
jgi:hypothetical protein